MNNQLKLLLYLVFIVIIFYFVQDRFELFDISLSDTPVSKEIESDSDDNPVVEEGEKESFVEIFRQSGDTVLVNIEVADTDDKRAQGLSGRRYLGDYDGMLFFFDTPSNATFWMKDMYIPLDIVFIDSKGFVIDIEENVQPCEDESCPLISSSSLFKYVLEVKSGFCGLNKVVVGDSLSINL